MNKLMVSQKRWPALLFLFFLGSLFSAPLSAGERSVSEDADGDGREETTLFYDGERLLRKEVDENADGRADTVIRHTGGKRASAEQDTDFDGQMDRWVQYDAAGKVRRIASDTDKDGKADSFREMLKGRNLVMREYDRNADGRVDKRALTEWKADKTVPTVVGNRLQRLPVPGYVAVWVEEDNDFDGKIDRFRERGNKNPSKERLGKPIS